MSFRPITFKLLTGTALLPLLVACGSGTSDGSSEAGGGGAGPSTGSSDSAASGPGAGTGGDEGSASAGGSGSGGADGGGTVEDSGARCARPTLPAASSLPAYETHHDPFLMLDGSRITKRSEWACRRAEIKAQVEEYESGPKPAVARENVTGAFSGKTLTVDVKEGAKSVSFSIDINAPAGAPSGPIPLLISLAGFGFITLDTSVFTSNGVATAVFNNNEIGAQSGGGSRGTGKFYDLYGKDHPASSMIAWAWGVSRIIDALEKTPAANIDPRRIAVTGCSRDGKGALTAGAFDERIALTIPQESGAGGSASWRVSQAGKNAGENVQTLSHAAGEQPWFRADFGSNFGSKVDNLPFDHHMVMGLVAPRALLVLDNKIDWLGIDSTFTAGSIAHAIWEGLGVPDRMGYWQLGGHEHCQFPSAQRAMLEAYVKKFLVGGGTDDTNVLESDGATADLDRWMEWTPPSLE
ncbi:glucuronyl esterase domain-containing protein [Sorangium sp. So ce176]|uniref:glucuronyl esterase domain-containing protein n=1 Tax=Sorangium sp. So ce176 TaxID=3133286 RepID=UPI003F6322F7